MAIDLNPENELLWVAEGRVFESRHGELSTDVAFETDLVMQTYDLAVRVPAGTVIVPLRVQVAVETKSAEVFQCIVTTSDNDPGITNHSKFTPLNLNTRYINNSSACTSYITATGSSGTAPTNIAELHRVYVQANIQAINESATFDQVVYSPLHGKGLVGIVGSDTEATAFMVQAGGGTVLGYIIAAWAEFTYDEFYAD